jgi:hypothetical protein
MFYGQQKLTIGKELGILEIENIKQNDQVIIYNKNGSEWMRFDLSYDSLLKAKGKISYTWEDVKALYNWNDSLQPYGMHLDYYILMFKCYENGRNEYKVIVNEQTGLEKYIKKDRFWILRNWQDHLLNSVATIDLDLKTNPIRTGPSKTYKVIELKETPFPIEPVSIHGDWLKVKYWEDDEEKLGWILWKKGNSFLISLYYLI